MRLQWMHLERCDRRRGGSCFSNGKAQIVRKKNRRSVENYCPKDENTIEIEGYGISSHTGKIPVYELLEGEDVTESSISKVVLEDGSILCDREEVQQFDQDTRPKISGFWLLADDGGKSCPAVYLKADVDASIKSVKLCRTMRRECC